MHEMSAEVATLLFKNADPKLTRVQFQRQAFFTASLISSAKVDC